MKPVAALFIGGLALAGLVAMTGKSDAKPAAKMPADLVQAMASALASGDPQRMRNVAAELLARGFPAEAADMIRAAEKIERERANAPKPAPAPAAPKPAPKVSTSPAPVPVVTPGPKVGPVTDPKALLASEVARNPKDTNKVRSFQLQEGLEPDGKYGPKTAVALMKYGHVPPTPLFWPKVNTQAAKTAYLAVINAQANADPVRREEWLNARAAVTGQTRNFSVVSNTKEPLTAHEKEQLQNLVAKTIFENVDYSKKGM